MLLWQRLLGEANTRTNSAPIGLCLEYLSYLLVPILLCEVLTKYTECLLIMLFNLIIRPISIQLNTIQTESDLCWIFASIVSTAKVRLAEVRL